MADPFSEVGDLLRQHAHDIELQKGKTKKAEIRIEVLKQVVKDLQSEASETRKNQKDMKKSIEALKVKLIAQAELFRTSSDNIEPDILYLQRLETELEAEKAKAQTCLAKMQQQRDHWDTVNNEQLQRCLNMPLATELHHLKEQVDVLEKELEKTNQYKVRCQTLLQPERDPAAVSMEETESNEQKNVTDDDKKTKERVYFGCNRSTLIQWAETMVSYNAAFTQATDLDQKLRRLMEQNTEFERVGDHLELEVQQRKEEICKHLRDMALQRVSTTKSPTNASVDSDDMDTSFSVVDTVVPSKAALMDQQQQVDVMGDSDQNLGCISESHPNSDTTMASEDVKEHTDVTSEEDTTVTVDVTSPVVMDTDGQGNVQKTDSTIVVSPGSSSPSSEVSGHHAVDVSMVTDTQRVPSPNDNQRIHTEEMEKATDNVHKICISQPSSPDNAEQSIPPATPFLEQSTTASAATPKFYTCNSNSGVEMPTPDLLIDSPTDSGFRFVPNPLRKRTLNPQRDTLTVTVTNTPKSSQTGTTSAAAVASASASPSSSSPGLLGNFTIGPASGFDYLRKLMGGK